MTALLQRHDLAILCDESRIGYGYQCLSDGFWNGADRNDQSSNNVSLGDSIFVPLIGVDNEPQNAATQFLDARQTRRKDIWTVRKFHQRRVCFLEQRPHRTQPRHYVETLTSVAAAYLYKFYLFYFSRPGARLSTSLLHRNTGARTAVLRTRSRVRAPFHHNITSGECAS